MNNYSCLDYWYFFWDDFCKEVEITTEQFMALFNNDIETDIPRHTYTMVSTVDNTPKVIKRDSDKATIHERNKTIEIEAPALIQVPEVIPVIPSMSIPEIVPINNGKTTQDDFTVLNRYEDDFEILDMV
jgi:hypothetical protein